VLNQRTFWLIFLAAFFLWDLTFGILYYAEHNWWAADTQFCLTYATMLLGVMWWLKKARSQLLGDSHSQYDKNVLAGERHPSRRHDPARTQFNYANEWR